MAEKAKLEHVHPFFIVDDIKESVAFYRSKLGFSVQLLIPEHNPFFSIVRRDGVAFCLKEITDDVYPMPNYTRHEWARWDAFAPDPDTLYGEYTAKDVSIHVPLADTDDGLRTFEIRDNSGYILSFGRPIHGDPA